jgi:hypothetical protein
MNHISTENREWLRNYAATTPGGIDDPCALEKLIAEYVEFGEEIEAGRLVDAATEVADMAYYLCKLNPASDDYAFGEEILATACLLISISIQQAGDLAVVKYTCRGAHGKDKERERDAVRVALAGMTL